MSKFNLLKPTSLFWIFTALVAAFLFLPQLLNEGMFFDGLAYSTIAANLASGEGSIWRPILSESMWNPFYGHPPLVMFIESLFFRLLGDGWFTERWYGLFIMISSILVIRALWNECFPNFKKLSWLPVLLWLITPGIYTFYARNLLEPCMGLFTSLSLLSFIKSTKTEKTLNRFLLLLISAGCVLAAFLCKGFPGLFPLAMPLLFGLIVGNWSIKKTMMNSVGYLGIFVLMGFILLSFESPYNAVYSYLETQVFGSISGDLGTHRDGHLHIIWVFLEDGMYMTIICAALIFWSMKKFKTNQQTGISKLAVFMIMMSVAASFPVAFSPKQSSFYILACFAPLAIGVAGLKAESLNLLFDWIGNTTRFALIFGVLVMLMFVGAVWLNVDQYKKPRPRDASMIADVKRIQEYVGDRKKLGSTDESLKQVTSIHVYLQRYGKIDLDSITINKDFILQTSNSTPPQNCHEIDLGLSMYRLFEPEQSIQKE